MPVYPGGSKALQEFISKNINYPPEAEEAGIEGSVIVGYDITDNGQVINTHIIKGLGHGCDEEALRVIGLLRYDKVRNQGIRVKISTKTTIHFNLNRPSITYSVTATPNPEKPEPGSGPKSSGTNYSYTIEF